MDINLDAHDFFVTIFFFFVDDGTTPDRIAQITGPPDRCQHAAEIITDLLRSVQV